MTQEEAYQIWLDENADFLQRFIREFVSVDVEEESDYYGSHWCTASISVNVPYEITLQCEANRIAQQVLNEN